MHVDDDDKVTRAYAKKYADARRGDVFTVGTARVIWGSIAFAGRRNRQEKRRRWAPFGVIGD
jgi:hypothetical protein